MSSLPASVQKVLAQADSMDFFKLAASGRLECTLNGHSIPIDNIGALETFVGGHLFCSLTSQLVKADMHNAKKHISGTRFLLAKERFMKDEADLLDEPTADAQTAKPIRRAHCKSQTAAAIPRNSQDCGPETDDSELSGSSERLADLAVSQSSSETSGERNGAGCSASESEFESEDAAEMANLKISVKSKSKHKTGKFQRGGVGECKKAVPSKAKPCTAVKGQKLKGTTPKGAHAQLDDPACRQDTEVLGRRKQGKSAKQETSEVHEVKGGKSSICKGEKQSLRNQNAKAENKVRNADKHSAVKNKNKKPGKKSCEVVLDTDKVTQPVGDGGARMQKRGRAGERMSMGKEKKAKAAKHG